MKQIMEQISRLYGLGEMRAEPLVVTGGLLHRMYRLETERGVYAVKLLDPEIMRRPEALGNMQRGEQVNAAFGMRNAAFDVCVSLGGVLRAGERYCVVYPWVEGRSVFPPQITAAHCRVMGHVLGCIHQANIHLDGMERCTQARALFDWSPCGDEMLSGWDAAAVEAQARLMDVQVISHRDLDPKNVMWRSMRPCVIDWEAAGYVNPWQELVELLNYWADDEEKARAMITAYGEHIPLREADWDAAIAAGMDGMLGWLHYQLHKEDGAEQVRATLEELHRYAARAQDLRLWLKM